MTATLPFEQAAEMLLSVIKDRENYIAVRTVRTPTAPHTLFDALGITPMTEHARWQIEEQPFALVPIPDSTFIRYCEIPEGAAVDMQCNIGIPIERKRVTAWGIYAFLHSLAILRLTTVK